MYLDINTKHFYTKKDLFKMLLAQDTTLTYRKLMNLMKNSFEFNGVQYKLL